jgi:NTP pyrophosphatase (non-canonical NTP hydrolase)
MDLAELQRIIEATYGDRDRRRGVPSTVAWLAEELGELAQAVRKGTADQQRHEFADVLAWVASLANQMDIDLTQAIERYASGCPRCSAARAPARSRPGPAVRDGQRVQAAGRGVADSRRLNVARSSAS